MTDSGHVWVIDDDHAIRWVLEKALRQAGLQVTGFEGGGQVMERLADGQPDAIVSDIRMPDLNGLELLTSIKQHYPGLPVIIMTAYSDLDSAVSAYESGAFEYLPKPFDVDAAVAQVQRALDHGRGAGSGSDVDARAGLDTAEIVGSAASMQEVFRAIGRLVRSSITVMINGESGTGKELVAQALHRHSPRAGGPFVALNTAAIPGELLESELFRHEKGAFTGARGRREGRFEQADGGTLFLDEIGDMPAELQTRLLRVLADGEFSRVGGDKTVRSDVRVIAATHQDLEQRVSEGLFREDLFHRLNVIRIRVPPLRERQEDIPLLARRFLDQTADELRVEPKVLLPETERYLQALPWPGNVRQLENTCHWLSVMAAGKELRIADLPADLRAPGGAVGVQAEYSWENLLRDWAGQQLARGEHDILRDATSRLERVLLEVALQYTAGRKQDAARRLGWGRNTLARKLKELGGV